MIEFMVIGLPRSGTTWSSNWLTTEKTICLHDPLLKYQIEDLDMIESSKLVGISCTVIGSYTEFLNNHPARKVILHRDEVEVSESLQKMGLDGFQKAFNLDAINGMHVDWKELFTNPKPIYEFLTGFEFDAERHAVLADMNIQPNLGTIEIDMKATQRFIKDITEAYHATWN